MNCGRIMLGCACAPPVAPTIVDGALACGRCLTPMRAETSSGSTRAHSQLDGQLPAGARSVKYLRAWRRGRAAGDAEVWAEGRARLMTPAAWARLSRAPVRAAVAKQPAKLSLVPTVDDELLAELGGQRRTVAR